MKHVKKIALALVCVMLMGVLGGCGSKFDAAEYLKATLDNSYKNDSSGLVKLKLGTAEEASDIYEEGIDTEVNAFLEGLTVSDTLEEEFREVFKDMFSKVKYTVGKAEKQSNGSFVVTVTYEKMIIFEPMMEDYMQAVMNLQGDASVAALSQEEQMEKLMEAMKDSMKNAMSAITYAEPAELTIKIELVDKLYTPNTNDLANLEMSLFDMEAVQ
ncbi:MAG: hypothetical protein NC094_02250 [Bacteroidales bacterium]|nr:hypothetical protein [Lachnoclostridium sp.]MCM1383498.1 hypothetical protein [Lachnoclostridium sp.]MCM1464219.1 hypothetical protein [Bacteroidales bacterium]